MDTMRAASAVIPPALSSTTALSADPTTASSGAVPASNQSAPPQTVGPTSYARGALVPRSLTPSPVSGVRGAALFSFSAAAKGSILVR